MKKIRFIVASVLVILLLNQNVCIWAAEGNEWYNLQEINEGPIAGKNNDENTEITPYTRYILGTSASIRKPSSDVIWMRVEVYCTETMKKITTTFTLQKKVGSSWVDVGKATASQSNTNSMYKTMEATGVSSGTYRCITNTQVVSNTGYTETSSAVSGTV